MGPHEQRGQTARDEAQEEEGERVVGGEEEGVRRGGAGVCVAGVLARKVAGGVFRLGFCLVGGGRR